MSDYETMGPQDHKTNDDGSARGGQWSVVSLPRRRPCAKAGGLSSMRQFHAAFTLSELVITVGVLVLVVFLATQLLKSAATVTTQGHKQMDADAQTRQVLDRMAIDFAQMVKRSDVDYYLKSSATPPPTGVRNLLQPGNDKIAFYSTVPGYYPSGSTSEKQGPLSLVAYQVNSNPTSASYNKLERMGKGLVWNAVSSSTNQTPVVFMPIPLASPIPTPELPFPLPSPPQTPPPDWQVIDIPTSIWSDSEVIGPQVFRFEYYYLLKGQTDPIDPGTTYSPMFTDTPWDTRICACPSPSTTPIATPTPTGTPIATPTPPSLCCHTAPKGMQDVAAVVVVIAVIDPTSKVLLSDTTNPPQIAQVASQLIDWGDTTCAGCPSQTQWQTTPGLLRAQWQNKLNGITNFPRPAISGIRVYERYLYLSAPTLLTP
jgi:hypothetical protein